MHIDPSIEGLERPMPPSDAGARRAAQQPSKPGVDLRLSLLRDAAILPWRCDPSSARDERASSAIVQAAGAVGGRPGAFLIGGGDPLRRGDVWELLTQLARIRPVNLGLCTPGHGVGTAVVQRLHAVGVQRMHVPFHCARQDAHDWLVGQAGALKTAHRAIRACIEAELPVAADIVVTRPTMPHLAETVAVLARLGVRTLSVRRLTAADVDGVRFVPLSPRLSLLEKCLEEAATVALERRVRLSLRDLPLCVAPRLRPLFAAADSEGWVMPDGGVRMRADAGIGCATCPGWPQCAGAPQDYVSRFGWEEFFDPRSAAVRVEEDVKDQKTGRTSAPMVFTWRGPHRVRCEACADAADDRSKAQPRYASTRVVRARLVQAARYRPSVVRLVGADLLAHPQAALLIYDALRLFRRVEVAGEASAVVDWSDLDLRRLKDLQRLDVALYGPDAATHDAHCGIPGAFAAMLRAVERLRTDTKIPVGAYAIVHDARWVPGFAEGWNRGALPGEPRFRLSARGSSLDDLVQCAVALPPGPARSALVAVLPRCVSEPEGLAVESDGGNAASIRGNAPQQIECGRSVPYHPCGSDPIGAFETCQVGVESCARAGCVGTAVGWQSTARSKRWTMSI
jgi:MoaA/NifB/PqqE/SkfB family radical SAM enzyme